MLDFKRFLATVVAAVTALATSLVGAESFPDRPVKLIVPLPAGTPSDAVARQVAQLMSQQLKQPVVVDNVPGGGGTIAARAAASAAPNGYTLLTTTSASIGIMVGTYKSLGFDPLAMLPVASVIALPPYALVVPAGSPIKTVQELVAHIRANPGRINFGGAMSTPPHLLGVMFKMQAGLDVTYVAYKGSTQSLPDLMAGRLDFAFEALPALQPLIDDGRLRPLAIVSEKRWHALPNVPTMLESGFPDYQITVGEWGLFAPPGTPADVIRILNAAVNESLRSSDAREKMEKLSVRVHTGTSAQFAEHVRSVAAKWTELVSKSGAPTQ